MRNIMKTIKLLGVGIIYTVILTISSAYAEVYRIGDLTIKDEKSHRSSHLVKNKLKASQNLLSRLRLHGCQKQPTRESV